MKKTTAQPKRLLLSSETVRQLQPLQESQLQAVVGGMKSCPRSIIKPEGPTGD